MNRRSDPRAPTPDWVALRGLSGWRFSDLGADLAGGCALAAIAIPAQMATARLAGFPPVAGFAVFIAGTLGFALFGASRVLSAGSDSTIAPIFAGALALVAASGSATYAEDAALLAAMVGVILIVAGLLRLGWIANLLSIPVTTGFLAGIAVHILVSQLPTLLALPAPGGHLWQSLGTLASELGRTNPYSLALGAGVFAVTFAADRIDRRIPGALIALIGATLAGIWFGLERHGVAPIGNALGGLPVLAVPVPDFTQFVRLVPLALVVAVVCMVQTAATTRAFPSGDLPPDVSRDFVGVGAGGILAGLVGGFAVNASPTSTAAVAECGGRSQAACLIAAALVAILWFAGARLLAQVPAAALAGVLFFVGQRIVRFRVIGDIWRQSFGEFCLVLATIAAIVLLPIQTGVGLGISLSLLHGIWTMTRARLVEFERIPGTTIWWPANPKHQGEKLDGVMVLAFQAPLAFMNVEIFARGIRQALARGPAPELIVLEASSIVEIDYTAAQSLAALLRRLRSEGIDFAVARLESTRALAAFERFGILDLLGEDRLFHSVFDAIETLRRPEPR